MCVNVCTTQISAFTRSVESLSVRQINNNNNKKNVNVSSTLLHAELQNSTGHEKKRNMATLTHVYLLLYYRRVTFFFWILCNNCKKGAPIRWIRIITKKRATQHRKCAGVKVDKNKNKNEKLLLKHFISAPSLPQEETTHPLVFSPKLPPFLVLLGAVLLHARHVRPELGLTVLQWGVRRRRIVVVHHDRVLLKALEKRLCLCRALLAGEREVRRQARDLLLVGHGLRYGRLVGLNGTHVWYQLFFFLLCAMK